MNWLTSVTKPKIATTRRKNVAAHVWETCPACGTMIYAKDLAAQQQVCAKCGYHLRLGLNARLAALMDKEYSLLPLPEVTADPLQFKDTKKYTDRLETNRKKTDQPDGCRALTGTINGQPVAVAAMDFGFMGGSMGRTVGEAIIAAAQAAVIHKKPLLAITASGGARMQEGLFSLMQMARTTAAIQAVKEAKLPYLVLLTDPTTGGVTASFAMLGDVTLAEPGAMIGFAGARVIQQTTREQLPEGFQTAEFLQEHGMVDIIAPREKQREIIGNLLALLAAKKAA